MAPQTRQDFLISSRTVGLRLLLYGLSRVMTVVSAATLNNSRKTASKEGHRAECPYIMIHSQVRAITDQIEHCKSIPLMTKVISLLLPIQMTIGPSCNILVNIGPVSSVIPGDAERGINITSLM